MTDYRVNLDIFAGPLDLLLYLVRKEEVDIYDIPIATITDQYLRYVDIIKQFDIDLAGDFLVMAATLMEIKSAMLLPKDEPEQAGQE
ncbi:MAG TPA: segregation/condensation protein A, partial [Sedimentisphaerales bacterium]|nr:segregation/condensation protein A [Sedimentisphaerales bacterium]